METINALIFFLLLLLYNYAMFAYNSFIYMPRMELWKIIFLTSIINSLLFIIPQAIHIDNIGPMVLYVICYAIQFNYIYKKNFLSCLFFSMAFMLNLYGIGLMSGGVISLVVPGSLAVHRTDSVLRMITTIFSLLPAILEIVIIRAVIKKEKIDRFLSHRKSVQMAVLIMGIVFLYSLTVINVNNYQMIDDIRIAVLNIKVGLICITGFLIAIGYGYIFAIMNLYQKQFENYATLIQKEQESIHELSLTVQKDSFTGLYLRDVAIERMQFYKKNSMQFYTIFVDMDGLKTVNDIYGHNEGDFYIQQVVEILKRNFIGTIVSRIGGDEFLITGTSYDLDTPLQNTLMLYEEVKAIKVKNDKHYNTSISYGLVNIDETARFDVENIIKIADERMYEFKQVNKKERKVKKIYK